jgi:hypothetical protein
MLVKLGDRYVNSSAVRSLKRVTTGLYDVIYDDGSHERVACHLDLDERLSLVPAPQDHVVLVITGEGRVQEHELLLFQADPADARRLPLLITQAGRFTLSETIGLRGPSGRVFTAEKVFESEHEFRAACATGA